MSTPHRLHHLVLAIIADLGVIDRKVGLSEAQLRRWSGELSRPEVRRQPRVFLDCVEAAMRLHQQRHAAAAGQLLLLSGIGLSDGRRAAARREGGDAWARMRPSRFSAVC